MLFIQIKPVNYILKIYKLFNNLTVTNITEQIKTPKNTKISP